MAHFTLFFKTPALRDRVAPLLDQIPPVFTFHLETGTPPVAIISETDPTWIGFPFPVRAGDVYLFDDEIPARAVGGAVYGQAAVRVRNEDPDDVVILRLWHEVLHAVGQPADDMHQLQAEWQTPIDRLLWWLWPHLVGGGYDVPYWHRRYYHWLTTRAAYGGA